MSIELKLDAELRADLGRGASRRLRHAGKVPAIVYGGHKDPVSVTLLASQINRLQQEEAFYSQILTIVIDGKKHQAVLKDMQRHPFKPIVLHIDLQRVIAGEKMKTSVPVHLLGEEELLKKLGGGMISRDLQEVEIECLPKDLPAAIEVDVSGLTLGASLHLSDLKLPKGVTIPALALGGDHNISVVSLHSTRADVSGGAGEEGEAGEATE